MVILSVMAGELTTNNMNTTYQAKKLKVQSFVDFVEETMTYHKDYKGLILTMDILKELWGKWEDFVYEMNFQVRLGK